MTFQELIVNTYEGMGEPTNYSPYTDLNDEATFSLTTPGAIKLAKFVNRAYKIVMSWKYPNGRILRFRAGYDWVTGSSPTIALTGATTVGQTLTVDGLGANDYSTRFLDWTVSVDGTGETFKVIACAYANPTYTLTLHVAPTTDLAGEDITLTKNFMRFIPTGQDGAVDNFAVDPNRIQSIIRLRNLNTSTDLTPREISDMFTSTVLSVGSPSQFFASFGRVMLDQAINDGSTYQMLYKVIPASMTLATETPVCTEPFHEAIAWFAIGMGRDMMQDFNGAWAARKNGEWVMDTQAFEDEVALENERLGWEVLI